MLFSISQTFSIKKKNQIEVSCLGNAVNVTLSLVIVSAWCCICSGEENGSELCVLVGRITHTYNTLSGLFLSPFLLSTLAHSFITVVGQSGLY